MKQLVELLLENYIRVSEQYAHEEPDVYPEEFVRGYADACEDLLCHFYEIEKRNMESVKLQEEYFPDLILDI